jgi:hypothetical protein
MKFGTRDIRSLYRAGSMKAAASELAKYNSDLVALPGSDRTRALISQQTVIHFSMAMGMLSLWDRLFVHKRIVSAVEWIEFVSDKRCIQH